MVLWIKIFLVSLCFVAAPVMAATRYASPSGSGSACTNINTPCSDATAISQAVAGDTVYFRDGVYSSSLNWSSRSGTNGNPITYSGYPGETATLQAGVGFATFANNSTVQDIVFQNFTVDGSTQTSQQTGVFLFHNPFDSDPVMAALRVQRIILQDLTIVQWTGHGIQGYFAEGVIIRRVKVSGSGRGCPWPGGSTCRAMQGIYGTMPGLIVEDSEFFNNEGYGIQIYNQYGASADNTVIQRNKIYGNLGDGGVVLGFGNNIQFYNNLVYNNSGGGIYPLAYGVTNAKVYNNTFYGNGSAPVLEVGGNGGATNTEVTNNIFANNQQGISNLGTNTMFTTNLCGSSATECATVGDPQFANGPLNDFHLTSGSPTSPTTNLCSTFTIDYEGSARSCDTSFGFGAYVFGGTTPPPNPDPVGIVAKYMFESGSGTTVVDSVGGDNTGTFTPDGGWVTPGLIGTYAGSFDGTRYVQISTTTGMRNVDAATIAGWVKLSAVTPGDGCDVFSNGDSFALRIYDGGTLLGFMYNGASWPGVSAVSVNVLDNLPHHLVLTYDKTFLRIYVDNANVATVANTAAINYGLGANVMIGNHGNGQTRKCTGLIDQVYVMDSACSVECVASLYNELVPLTGVAMTNYQFTANDGPQSLIGSLNGSRSQPLSIPFGLEANISNNSGSEVTEYFPLACQLNGGGFAEVSNTFGALGIKIADSAYVNMGDSTSQRLPIGSQTYTAGRVVADTIDTGQTTILPHGGITSWRYVLMLGSPAVASDVVECRPVREAGGSFDHYLDDVAALPSITVLTAPSGRVMAGGAFTGGVR